MYQAKVNNTEQYSDSQGEHVVCKGRLILLKKEDSPLKMGYFTPYIISEHEEIEEGDKALTKDLQQILYAADHYDDIEWLNNNAYKILALPEHFSDKHLQAIVDGKMRSGDGVLVKCESQSKMSEEYQTVVHVYYKIHLDQQNHITLFPAKQSLEEAADEWSINPDNVHPADSYIAKKSFMAGAEWAKSNNYKRE